MMWFDGWPGILRTVASGLLAYAALIAILRISGKRTLSKMNTFDLVVTVALGSTLATIMLSPDVTLAAGLASLVTLIAAQYAVSWSSVRWGWIRTLVKSEPTLLLQNGQFLDDALQRERVTHDEVIAAIRSAGITRIEDAAAVVLETDGNFTTLIAPDRRLQDLTTLGAMVAPGGKTET